MCLYINIVSACNIDNCANDEKIRMVHIGIVDGGCGPIGQCVTLYHFSRSMFHLVGRLVLWRSLLSVSTPL